VLRLGHSFRRSLDATSGEVDFINYLADDGLSVPRALPSREGALVEPVRARQGHFVAVLFERAPGGFVRQEGWNDELFVSMGAYLGQLHALSRRYAPERRLRPDIFEESVPLLDDFIPQQDSVIRDRANELIERLRALPQDAQGYGMIHVDFHRGNFFVHDGQVWLFDFDDCQYSWFVHDIAMALFYALPHRCSSSQDVQRGHNFLRRFLAGYYRENELDRDWLKEIPAFLKLRELELYAAINRSFDLDNLDPWTASFMEGRKARLEEGAPYFELDVDGLDTV
jgi:Ser/Thr protein kinase RdoA (MazF antagonist)